MHAINHKDNKNIFPFQTHHCKESMSIFSVVRVGKDMFDLNLGNNIKICGFWSFLLFQI
jgi:hypothetical protein